jgi:hypothetical protein
MALWLDSIGFGYGSANPRSAVAFGGPGERECVQATLPLRQSPGGPSNDQPGSTAHVVVARAADVPGGACRPRSRADGALLLRDAGVQQQGVARDL